MILTIEPKLESFLRKERVLTAFKINTKKHNQTCSKFNSNNMYGSFIFSDTIEGHKYWWNLHNKYDNNEEN